MWTNKLFGCVSETLEISSQTEEDSKSKSLKNSLNNLTNGSYSNLTNQDEIKQQVSIVQKLADSAGRLNRLDKLASPEKKEKKKEKKEKKVSQASTQITMTSTVASKKKLVTSEIAPQFSRKQNETYAQ